MATLNPDDWPLLAKCRGMNDALFPEGKDQKRAKAICMGCPVRAQCLAEALDNHIEWGVWGGMTERERRQLLRQRPDVKSWSSVLNAAMRPVGDDCQETSRVVVSDPTTSARV